MRADAVVLAALLALSAFAPAARADGRDVVFLLGEDRRGVSPFYSAAAAYYRRTSPDARVVATVRTLAGVREYLVRHRGSAGWDEIVLVAHGAPWMGLLVPVHPGGPRASLEAVEAAADDGAFPPLPRGVLGPATRVRLESCGLGRRPEFLAAFGRLFGVDPGTRVIASSRFVGYRIEGDAAVRFELPFVSRVVPDDGGATRDAALGALHHEFARLDGADAGSPVLQETPITIRVAFPDRLPDAAAARARRLAGDPSLTARLRSYGLGVNDLAWSPAEPGGGDGTALVGRATLLVLRAGGGPPLPGPGSGIAARK